jgi:TolA-binding protein
MIVRPRLPLCSALVVLALLSSTALASEGASGPSVAAHPANEPAKPAAKSKAPAPPPAVTLPTHAATPTTTPAPAPKKIAVEPPAPASAAPKPNPTDPTPAEIQGLLHLGASLTERADYEAASIAYRQVLNARHVSTVDLKTALLGLAHMHRRQGALTKAAAIYERFLKDYPGDERTPDAYLDLGRTLRSMGVYKLAISRFYNVINSTLKLPSEEGFARYQLLAKTAQFEIAETHFQAGDYAEAAKFFSRLRLLDLAPADRARATFKSAYSLRLEGSLEDAVTGFKSFIDQYPGDENVPEARYLLAVSLRELKRPQEAFRAVLDLLHTEKSRVDADPKRWAYWQRRTGNQLANDFFESGDMLNAHAIYSGLVELSPEPAWRLPIIYQLALCYERLGLPDRARTSYQAIIAGAGATPPPDLAELVKMSAWRVENLAWHDNVAHQVTAFFETRTGKVSAVTPAPKPASSDLSVDLSTAKSGPATKTAATP